MSNKAKDVLAEFLDLGGSPDSKWARAGNEVAAQIDGLAKIAREAVALLFDTCSGPQVPKVKELNARLDLIVGPSRRCGTCVHFSAQVRQSREGCVSELLVCTWAAKNHAAIPSVVADHRHNFNTHLYSGRDCPTWEAKP
jgi:hypothetical protein